MTKIKDVVKHLESIAPLDLQESYDNSGLLTGDLEAGVTGILTTLDCTEEVIAEAMAKGCNLVVSHHPIIFSGLKSLTGKDHVERTVIKAIKNEVAIYAIHTNLDNLSNGVNKRLCDLLGLINTRILQPKSNLFQLVTFIPSEHLDRVLNALHAAGAGSVGNYDECSFRVEGTGSYRPNENASPHQGQKNEKESVNEYRVEVILDSGSANAVIKALTDVHPYEEVAYYLTSLSNQNNEVGAGMIGNTPQDFSEENFIQEVKDRLGLKVIRHTRFIGKPIHNVAVCGGSGSFLISAARSSGADVLITSDIRYHDYFLAENDLLVLDIGHYESEVHTKELLHDILCEKFTTFAVNLSETVTNPISYL